MTRVGADLAKKDEGGVFDYKKDRAHSTVAACLAQAFTENVIYTHKPSNGEPALRIVGLTCGKFVGEVVELDNRVIHLLVNRID